MAPSLGMHADAPRGKAGDWEGVINILIQEHGYILSLLDTLEEKTGQLERGKVPDFLLLRDMIDYATNWDRIPVTDSRGKMNTMNAADTMPTPNTAVIDENGDMLLGARKIPVPSTISEEAQAAIRSAILMERRYPEQDDVDGWKENVRESNERMEQPFLEGMGLGVADENGKTPLDAVETVSLAGVPVHTLTPEGLSDDRKGYAFLVVHGGALIYGAGVFAKAMAIGLAPLANCKTYSVDYRVGPEHPYPAALDDTVAVYLELEKQYGADNIVIHGGSAGGNLAAAAVLKVRDEGHNMPAALVLQTPELDLTESGDTFKTLEHIDHVLNGSLMPVNKLYAGEHDLTDPYLSPLFGDFGSGFPPTYLQSGTRDLFLSNTVLMHRKLLQADVHAELHV